MNNRRVKGYIRGVHTKIYYSSFIEKSNPHHKEAHFIQNLELNEDGTNQNISYSSFKLIGWQIN